MSETSTADKDRVCMRTKTAGRGYCGRKVTPAKVAGEWAAVVCTDCKAARRADARAGRTGE